MRNRLSSVRVDDLLAVKLEKIRLDVSSDSSARQRINMKIQALFSSKDKI